MNTLTHTTGMRVEKQKNLRLVGRLQKTISSHYNLVCFVRYFFFQRGKFTWNSTRFISRNILAAIYCGEYEKKYIIQGNPIRGCDYQLKKKKKNLQLLAIYSLFVYWQLFLG